MLRYPDLAVAEHVLEVVARTLGCSVDCAQVTRGAGRYARIVVFDEDFSGAVDAKLLAGAIVGRFGVRMRYCGPVVHEGGTVTIEIARAKDGGFDLRVSEGV